MTTFSTSLKLELIGDGQQSGTWGQTTNKNFGTLLEEAICGVDYITMLDANYTLTNFNGVSDEARQAIIIANGTNSAIRDIIAPLVNKLYIISNQTVGGYAIRIRGASGNSVTIPNGLTVPVYCDSINFNTWLTGTADDFFITGDMSAVNAFLTNITASTATFSGAISSVSPSFTGTPTAPTAAAGTNSTQIATTAFVQGVAGALGTMSTQNANAVAITGGTITGTTINGNVVGSNSVGTRTVSSSAPSGGSNGDIWYQV